MQNGFYQWNNIGGYFTTVGNNLTTLPTFPDTSDSSIASDTPGDLEYAVIVEFEGSLFLYNGLHNSGILGWREEGRERWINCIQSSLLRCGNMTPSGHLWVVRLLTTR
jgi:hypothetical protein